MSAFKYFTKIDFLRRVPGDKANCVRVQRRRPGAKTTEVEARMATYNVILVCASADHQRQAAHRRYELVEVTSDKPGPCINGTHKCQKFTSSFRCKA